MKYNLKHKDLAINGGEPVRKEFIPIHLPYFTEEDYQAVDKAMRSTFVSGDGPQCREFEKQLAEYLGMKHVFFMNSCTGALDLAFMVKEFPEGSEVIVPNFTYTSTALGPMLNNLKVVLVDVEPDTGNIDVSKIEEKITSKTVAIMPVDYAGNPADMDAINEIAKRHNLYVVHDTAQSLGARYKGRLTGTLADVSTFSFHGTKNLTTGEGGALVTNDDELAEKIKIARDKGTDKYAYLTNPEKEGFYEYVSSGNSYVQSNILGALGSTQLAKLDWMNSRRKQIAKKYLFEFKDIPNIKLPPIKEGYESNWHLFYILVPTEIKWSLLDIFKAEGVASNVHYNPLHRNNLYKDLGNDKDFPNSIKFYSRLIRLPIYPSLNNHEVESIIKATQKIFRNIFD
jgi:perosamine synthetase